MTKLFFIGTVDSRDYTVRSAAEILHTTYNSAIDAIAALPAFIKELEASNRADCEISGEEYSADDKDYWHAEDLRIRTITIDDLDYSE